MTKDYAITLKDSDCRTVSLFINGASIDELIETGLQAFEARESIESDAFEKAIARGLIGADAWLIASA